MLCHLVLIYSVTPEDDSVVLQSLGINEEEQESGAVKLEIYKKYWLSVGMFLSPAILLSLTLMQGTRSLTDVW